MTRQVRPDAVDKRRCAGRTGPRLSARSMVQGRSSVRSGANWKTGWHEEFLLGILPIHGPRRCAWRAIRVRQRRGGWDGL